MTNDNTYHLLTAIILQWMRDARKCEQTRAQLQHFLDIHPAHLTRLLTERRAIK